MGKLCFFCDEDAVDRCDDCSKYICSDHKSPREKCPDCRSGGGWCFIATAAYGTPFSQEIDALRDWRDHTLQNNALGRAFIKTYYTLSPPVADFIRDKPSLRRIARMLLKPIVVLAKRR